MNILLTLVPHKKPNANQSKSNQTVPNHVYLNDAIMSADTVNGKAQYPNTHNDWKMEIVAPSNCALMVTTREPNHMTINTVVNTWEVWCAGALVERISARERQINNGPLLIRKLLSQRFHPPKMKTVGHKAIEKNQIH